MLKPEDTKTQLNNKRQWEIRENENVVCANVTDWRTNVNVKDLYTEKLYIYRGGGVNMQT
jgi:hypothetical protein